MSDGREVNSRDGQKDSTAVFISRLVKQEILCKDLGYIVRMSGIIKDSTGKNRHVGTIQGVPVI